MSVTWLEVPAGIDQELHSHEEAEQVYIVVSGRGTMTVAGDKQEVAEGDLVLVPPATDHSIAQRERVRPLLRLGAIAAGDLLRGLRPLGRRRRLRVRTKRSSSLTRKRVVVSGRVQGVFFRDTIRRRAEAAGVAGWVRNTREGTVEAVFEGEPEAVDELVEFSRHGPSRAEVAVGRGDRGGAGGPLRASRSAELAPGRLLIRARSRRLPRAARGQARLVPELSRSQLLVYAVIAVAVLLIGARWIRSSGGGSDRRRRGELRRRLLP